MKNVSFIASSDTYNKSIMGYSKHNPISIQPNTPAVRISLSWNNLFNWLNQVRWSGQVKESFAVFQERRLTYSID